MGVANMIFQKVFKEAAAEHLDKDRDDPTKIWIPPYEGSTRACRYDRSLPWRRFGAANCKQDGRISHRPSADGNNPSS
jgi:hypothetical protein